MVIKKSVAKRTFFFLLFFVLTFCPEGKAQVSQCIFNGYVSIDSLIPQQGTVIQLLKKNRSFIRQAYYNAANGFFSVSALSSDGLANGDSVLFRIIRNDSIIARTLGDPPVFNGNLLPNPPKVINLSLYYFSLPETPALIAPLNNAMNQASTITFVWSTVSNATMYYLQVANNASFDLPLVDDSLLTSTNKTVNGFAFSKKYYWRVKAKNSFGESSWSVVWSFTTMQQTIAVAYEKKWNILAVPLQVNNMATVNLFPTANSAAFTFSNGYFSTDTLKTGSGFWLRFPDTVTTQFTGTPVTGDTIPVRRGWNLVGVYNRNARVTQLSSTPAGIISSNFFSFSNLVGYRADTLLLVGKGYWVRSDSNGFIRIPRIGEEHLCLEKLPVPEMEPLGSIEFADNAMAAAKLLLDGNGSFTSNSDLPPLPPEDVFDIRFSSNRNRGCIEGETQEIHIQGASHPVTIRVKGCSLILQDKLSSGRLLYKTITPDKPLVLSNPLLDRLVITKSSSAAVTNFSLQQNYPNPFNPSTTIHFSIEKDGYYTLTVYDQLGAISAVIMAEKKTVGNYHVAFNAAHLSTGIYFFELAGNGQRAVKKAVFIK